MPPVRPVRLWWDVLGALVQSADSATVVEGHAAGGDGHMTKGQRHGEGHVIWGDTADELQVIALL